jgi:hypothetical protein
MAQLKHQAGLYPNSILIANDIFQSRVRSKNIKKGPEIQLCSIQDNPVVDEPNQVASCSLYCGKKLRGLQTL